MSRPTWTLSEAAEKCAVSRSTLRRALDAGRIEGAYKDSDGAWKLPLDGILAAGIALKRPELAPTSEPAPETAHELAERVRELESALRIAQAQREAAERVAAAQEQRADTAERALRMIEASPVPRSVSSPTGSSEHVQEHPNSTTTSDFSDHMSQAGESSHALNRPRSLWGRIIRRS